MTTAKALVPAALAHVWFFGPGFIFNLLVAGIFATAGEAAMMWVRGRPPEVALGDFSALVTAALLAFVGAWVLALVAGVEPILSYTIGERACDITPGSGPR